MAERENLTAEPEAEAVSQTELPVLTPRAVEKVRVLLEKEGGEGIGLRLGVTGGGCSGLSYAMKLDRPRMGDHRFEQDGVPVHVDRKSFLYLKGITVDYEETLMHYGFTFKNPNASHSCSCGTSFTV
jgi:iron-sulfur cluster assembly protein